MISLRAQKKATENQLTNEGSRIVAALVILLKGGLCIKPHFTRQAHHVPGLLFSGSRNGKTTCGMAVDKAKLFHHMVRAQIALIITAPNRACQVHEKCVPAGRIASDISTRPQKELYSFEKTFLSHRCSRPHFCGQPNLRGNQRRGHLRIDIWPRHLPCAKGEATDVVFPVSCFFSLNLRSKAFASKFSRLYDSIYTGCLQDA